MKKITLFIATLLLAFAGYSQTIQLAKLSAGKPVSGTILYDREQDDIYGYFYIFEKDKTDKYTTQYQYILLDKNLNKVADGEFKESLLITSWGSGSLTYSFNPVYRNGMITLGIFRGSSFITNFISTYRILDVKENKLSDEFTLLPDLTKQYNPPVRKRTDAISFNYRPNPFGYYLYGPVEAYKDMDISHWNIFYFVDEKLESKWSYSYNQGDKNRKEYTAIGFQDDYDYRHNKNILTAYQYFAGDKNTSKIKSGKVPRGTYLFFDKNNGKQFSQISPFGEKTKESEIKDVSNNKIFIDENNNKITFINLTMNSKKNILDENLIQGFSKVEYSLNGGAEQKRDYFSWNQLSTYLTIDENGYVKEKDDPNCYLYLHDVIRKDNGNLIFIMEEYKTLVGSMGFAGAPGAKINDLFFMELDKDMKVVQFQRIDKERKTVRNGIKMSGSMVALYGYFDYSGYQDLGNDNYLFFYYNKQKPEGGGKKQWILGIVSYTDGKFSEQKLPLKSEDGSDMAITPAKKGYIMVYETFKDKNRSPELRLEKINY